MLVVIIFHSDKCFGLATTGQRVLDEYTAVGRRSEAYNAFISSVDNAFTAAAGYFSLQMSIQEDLLIFPLKSRLHPTPLHLALLRCISTG
jgi:hypothetical protein